MPLQDTLSEVYDLAAKAEMVIKQRNQALLYDHTKDLRHFTKAEITAWLGGIHQVTLDRWCDALGFDPKNKDKNAAWLLDINEAYELRTALRGEESKVDIGAKFNRTTKQMMQVYAIANQKGGTGKTVATVNLASYIAVQSHEEYRIGLIDSDPQGTGSMYYTERNHKDLEHICSLGDLLLGDFELREDETFADRVNESFLPTTIPNLRILRAKESDRALDGSTHKKIANGEFENPYRMLDEILDAVKDEFDIILIDTPPHMTYPVFNCLYAATSLIIPMTPSENDMDATMHWLTNLPAIFETMMQPEFGMTPYDNEIKFLLTNHDGKATSLEIEEKMEAAFDTHVLPVAMESSEAYKICAMNLNALPDISKSDYHNPRVKVTNKKPYDEAMTNLRKVSNQFMKMVREVWNNQEAN